MELTCFLKENKIRYLNRVVDRMTQFYPLGLQLRPWALENEDHLFSSTLKERQIFSVMMNNHFLRIVV